MKLLIAKSKKYKNQLIYDNKAKTYNYYHNGKLIWSESGDESLNNIAQKLFECNHMDTQLSDLEMEHPIFKKYYESCEKMLNKE